MICVAPSSNRGDRGAKACLIFYEDNPILARAFQRDRWMGQNRFRYQRTISPNAFSDTAQRPGNNIVVPKYLPAAKRNYTA
jgi:hypothetical protein